MGDLSDSQQHVYELSTLPKESNICPSEKHLVALEVHRRRHQPTFLVWWGQKALGSWKGSVPLEIDRLAEGRVPIRNAPTLRIRLPRHRRQPKWDKIDDPVVPLARNLYGHPLAGLLWKRKLEEFLRQENWENPELGMLIPPSKDKLFLSVYVDDIKMVGRRESLAPM